MLRSTRKSSVMGAVDVSIETGPTQERNGRTYGIFPNNDYHTHSTSRHKINPYVTKHSSSINSTILSHFATAITTALLMLMISTSLLSARDKLEMTNLILNNSQRSRNVRFERNIRPSRHGTNSKDINENILSSTSFYDIVVVGAGPAGLTASLFAARAGLQVLVVGSESGLLSEATSLDNFPSWIIETISDGNESVANFDFGGGQVWLETTRMQAAAAGVNFALPGLMVSKIIQAPDSLYSLNISGKLVPSMAVILATGATGRKLNLPHEEQLFGKSIHSCAICDGSSYKNKTVVVVGGGDAAIDAAILLSRHARLVVVVHRRDTFRASSQRNVETMLLNPMITLKTPFVISRYVMKADQIALSGIQARNTITNETEDISCDGVFLMIGSVPNTQFLMDFVQIDDDGCIEQYADISTASTSTSMEGVFAAGEVTDKQYKQAITAAAAGARAAIDADRWLRQQFHEMNNLHRTIPESIPLQSFGDHRQSIDNGKRKRQELVALDTEIETNYNPKNECVDLRRIDCIESLVLRYPVVVFSKSWCPYCKKALEALSLEGVSGTSSIFIVNLDELDAPIIQSTLAQLTGRRTVPNVFIGGKTVGGGDETVHLQRNGDLHTLLVNAKAINES
jgi:thioredoxin reductase (NADPH)